MQQNHYLVPAQQQGSQLDIEHHIIADTADDADYLFVDAKDRLLDVNNWNKCCAGIEAEFRLTDSHGLGVGRHARKGDLLRVDASGISKVQPTGFEWLSIEAIEYDDYPDLAMESFAMRVRGVADPLDKGGHEHMPLMPDDDTTITFVIERRGLKLYATYHGRNGAGNSRYIPDKEWELLIISFITDKTG